MERNSTIWYLGIFTILFCLPINGADWGFYAHRKINYYAVLTIPPPLNQFFKYHIDYLSVHAVDPDTRRYASLNEGPRHFIDLDRWYQGDSLMLTGDYVVDRMSSGQWEWRTDDTTLKLDARWAGNQRLEFTTQDFHLSIDSFAARKVVLARPVDSLYMVPDFLYPGQKGSLYYLDTFTSHGIVPYYIELSYHRLIKAMIEGEEEVILRLCADLGHYISDAHVPLHTTSNYNGQNTGQIGIHAFWESRIPELFESSHFSSLAGKAQYIPDIQEFIWDIVKASYSLVPKVLEKEIEARKKIASHDHYCYEERGNQLVRTQCPELTRTYMELLDGMVQDRWRASIHAVGSVWYSAWLDAGKPDLWTLSAVVDPDTGLLDRWWNKLDLFSKSRRNSLHE